MIADLHTIAVAVGYVGFAFGTIAQAVFLIRKGSDAAFWQRFVIIMLLMIIASKLPF